MMNIFAFGLICLASVGIKSKHSSIRRLFSNDAYVKLLIILGALKWHDMPHLHHPLIHLKIDLEWRGTLLKEVQLENPVAS